ncbi:NACHT domain-containing protein [Nocardiopsis baichengensis]|uniref:NACHT domain-containing protein n=1 Tax=Nocardiopsis baichengensis TaxID=280240 RepID=UPI000372716E|nr:NACHT domain-containing protein [Nocardiopsis baichengensis]
MSGLRTLGAVGAAAGILGTLAAALWWGGGPGTRAGWEAAAWGAAIVAALALIVAAARWAAVPVQRPKDPRWWDQAAEELAQEVQKQWRAEAGTYALHRPEPLPVTLSFNDRLASDSTGTVAYAASGTTVQGPREHGDIRSAAPLFLGLPRKRLVVVGAPGSGKTGFATLLTLEMLEERHRYPGAPVPVLVQPASWEPEEEHLCAWIARCLEEDHPALRRPALGPGTAEELVMSGRVLPILDGLDELSADARGRALAAVDRALLGRPLVLTSRTAEYQEAVHRSGGLISGAAVLELQPVRAEDAAKHLHRPGAHGSARWERVAARLREDPTGELAAALSSPLMVTLAKTVYSVPGTDPGDLVEKAAALGRRAVERHLLRAYVPAAYSSGPPPPRTPAERRQPTITAHAADGYLQYLALLLTRGARNGFGWWHLHTLVPSSAYATVTAAVAALVTGIVIGGVYGPDWGVPAALAAGAAALVAALTEAHSQPHSEHERHGVPAAVGRLLLGAAAGIGVGVMPQAAFGFDIGPWQAESGHVYVYTLVHGTVGALAALAVATPVAPARVNNRIRWNAGVRRRLITGLGAGSALGLCAGAVFATAFVDLPHPGYALAYVLGYGTVTALITGTSLAAMAAVLTPLESDTTVTPHSVLRTDQAVALGAKTVVGFGAGAVFGSTTWVGTVLLQRIAQWHVHGGRGISEISPAYLTHGLGSLVASGARLGVVIGALLAFGLGFVGSCWGRTVVARVGPTALGRLPIRLYKFLDGAHRCGILRQSGALYQFRHARLQEELARSAVDNGLARQRNTSAPDTSAADTPTS